MPLFLKSKVCFIHIPRSGGSFIESLFAQNNDAGIFLSPYQMMNGTSPQHQNFDMLNFLNIIPKGFKVFTVIRDDVDRFLSEYNWLLKRNVIDSKTTFSAFLDDFLNTENAAKYDNHNMPNSWFLKTSGYTSIDIITIPHSFLYQYKNNTPAKVASYLNRELRLRLVANEEIDRNDSISDSKISMSQVSKEDMDRILKYCKENG
jgi:hypothetical protein